MGDGLSKQRAREVQGYAADPRVTPKRPRPLCAVSEIAKWGEKQSLDMETYGEYGIAFLNFR